MATSVYSATLAFSGLTISTSSTSTSRATQELSKSSLFGHLPSRFSVSWTAPNNTKSLIPARAASSYLLDDDEEEDPEEVRKGYEELYGAAFSRLSKKSAGDEEGFGRRGAGRDRGAKDNMEEKVVQVRRVTKVVKGGKQLSFRAVVIVGDRQGKVGVGVGKAKEVIAAVQKAGYDARRHLITIPMTKHMTFPHRADGKYGAAKVMLRPAALGTGVIAGGSVRTVLELGGVVNALGKQLGSENPLNNARAVVEAISGMKQFKEVAEKRGIPMEELWQ